MAASSSLSQFSQRSVNGSGTENVENVEMDPQLASSLGFAQGDIVDIGLLHDTPQATSVQAEPLTPDDWDLLESNAGYVEDNLLAQVRCVSVGAVVCVWVLGRSFVRFKILSVTPGNSGKGVVLLGTDTEVVIAPKSRRPPPSSSTATTTSKPQSQPNGKEGNAAKEGGEPRKRRILRVIPSKHFILSDDEGDELPLAFVSRQVYTSITTHPPPSSSDNDEEVLVWVKRMIPPFELRRRLEEESKNSNSNAAESGPKILHPSASTGKNDAQTEKEKQERFGGGKKGRVVRLRWTNQKEVLENHILIIGLKPSSNTTRESKENGLGLDGVGDLVSQAKPKYDLAGITPLLNTLSKFYISNLTIHLLNIFGAQDSFGSMLLYGRKGSGKSCVARCVGEMLESYQGFYTHTVYVDLSQYTELKPLELKKKLQGLIEEAAWYKPSLLILDGVDKIVPPENENQPSFTTLQKAELFTSLFTPSPSPTSQPLDQRGIMVLGTAESKEAVHEVVGKKWCFGRSVGMARMSSDSRRDILSKFVQKKIDDGSIVLSTRSEDAVNYTSLALEMEGYLPIDIADFVSRTLHRAAIRNLGKSPPMEVGMRDFEGALRDYVPVGLRDVKAVKSDVGWGDIGGLRETKRVLRETLELPTRYAAIYSKAPLRLRSGILLYGYPGCGKTLLASAIAKECGLNFITVKGPELLNKYIGASEKSVRDVFERASAARPCVLFFDEFDSIAPKRGHDSTGVTDRVVNQMLTQMDGAEGLEGVYVLAASSRPDLIDPALLRPGRLDSSLLCGMPTLDERREILQALTRKIPIEDESDLDEIAQSTEGYSGADLQALMYNAHLEIVHASISALSSSSSSSENGQNGVGNGNGRGRDEEELPEVKVLNEPEGKVMSRAEMQAIQRRVAIMLKNRRAEKDKERGRNNTSTAVAKKVEKVLTLRHLRNALGSTRPSVPPDEVRRLQRIYTSFVSDRESKLTKPDDTNESVGIRVSLA
ncbi:AAA-domain-containing protein [Sistotremastrum niveocremeum HHB9708]|uniref:Peroxisomal ATPase PEX1 n=1 Tax=Sistotremastrum niveocremeum HHB9708 TaxID=1314777 RepID=A0A164PMH4_9AGAM|nr:AAA-domain-containing protein [Sistotremastrum niveocremeum HHB9708]